MTSRAARTARFYDEYGEREWWRFDDGRTPFPSLHTHVHLLERFVKPGDRVLDAGCGPGRFTIELARLGARVVALDVSPRQLELHRERVAAAGCDAAVEERVVADVVDLSQFEDASFDATVCFGGPLSYLLDDAERGIAELARVTRPGGHVLLSVMSLVGSVVHFTHELLELARRDGADKQLEIVRTRFLPGDPDYGHLDMRLFTWSELEPLLAAHGRVVAGAAAGLLLDARPDEPELQDFLVRLEAETCEEPGARSCGQHIVAVLERVHDGLTFPRDGLRDGDIVLRLPTVDDAATLSPAFLDPEIAGPGNLPPLAEAELRAFVEHMLSPWMASGRLLPLVVCNGDGTILGGGTLHHLDRERSIVELGYWLFPAARGRGVATRVARLLAAHAFSLGIERVTAMVDVGHVASERVLERSGFTREGVLRSMPRADGTRADRTIFSLLRDE